MITEDYVSFEVAKLLKEKGFDELCRCVYSPEGVFHKSNRTNIFDDYDNALLDEVGNADYFLAPTQAQVMKWLREVHNLHCDIGYDDLDWFWNILDVSKSVPVEERPKMIVNGSAGFSSYEQACESAIRYCLENLI